MKYNEICEQIEILKSRVCALETGIQHPYGKFHLNKGILWYTYKEYDTMFWNGFHQSLLPYGSRLKWYKRFEGVLELGIVNHLDETYNIFCADRGGYFEVLDYCVEMSALPAEEFTVEK